MSTDEPLRILAQPGTRESVVNPYTRLLYREIGKRGHAVADYTRDCLRGQSWHIWHMHFPEAALTNKPNVVAALLKARKRLALIDEAKRSGIKIVWTVHNLQAHQVHYPATERHWLNALTARLDGALYFGTRSRALAQERYPRLKDVASFIVPHGHFRDMDPRRHDRASARASLGIDLAAPVIVYFGTISPYKNVPHLVRTFRALSNPQARLLICGAPRTKALAQEILQAAEADPRIQLELHFITETDAEIFLKIADLLVLPYSAILNSGSAMFGLSFDRRVLVPRLGAMADLQDIVGHDWLRCYDGKLTVADLTAALAWARALDPAAAPLQALDWANIASQTIASYRSIMDR